MSTVTTQQTWEYRAVDGGGTKRSGTLQGKSEQEIFRQLSAMGLTPMAVKLKSAASSGRMNLRALSQFTNQLAVLMGARMSISEGLLSLAEQETEPKIAAIIRDIASRVASGETIADSLTHHPRTFSTVYIATVRSAEKSGNLAKALEFLSNMLEREEETRRQVRGALMYPACVIVALSGAVLFLVSYIVPKFANMFAERGVELPFLTHLLRDVGQSFTGYWYLYLLGIAALIFAFRFAWKNPKSRLVIDAAFHKIPFIRKILVGVAIQRFAQVLGVSIHSGIGLIDSLQMAGESAGRPMLSRDVDLLVQSVRSGSRLAEVFPKCTYLTPFTKRMLTVGEASAELSRMCGVVAKQYEQQTQSLTKNLSTVIEPILIAVITGVVLVVALAIFLPMWSMAELIA
jgi:type II secretory pathway component PulF